MYKIGIDLGGTKIEGILEDNKNNEIIRKRIPTEQEKGYNSILKKIKILYDELLIPINKKSHTLGMGIPGTISDRTQLIKNSNTVCLIGKPLKRDIEKILNHRAEIQNDANCFTMAEALWGAGKNNKTVFGIIMGTGCGGGIIIDGKIRYGKQGIAGEWGHMQIDPSGPECYCGKKGCVETFISGGGIQNIYKNKFNKFKTVQEIIFDYRKGNLSAKGIFNDFIKHFGIALANVIDILDPDIVVIGGGLSNIDELYTMGIKEVSKNIFSDSLETSIVKNRLGDSAGVLGAAYIGI